MSTWSLVAAASSTVLAAFMAWVLLRHWRWERALRDRGVVVKGRVLELVEHGGDGFHGRIGYRAEGVDHEIFTEQSTHHDVGDEVPVRVLLDRPHHARLDEGMERWHGTVGGVVFVAIFVGGAVASVILGLLGVF